MHKKYLKTALLSAVLAVATVSSVATAQSRLVNASAYNSLGSQTDSTPNITATGTRTRPGVIALSRDLLRVFPYGTRVTLADPTGKFNSLLKGRIFVVEDTMNARKYNSVDVWMQSYNQAMKFGVRNLIITKVR